MKPTSLPWRIVARPEQGTSNGRRITLDAQSGIVADLDWNAPQQNEANAVLIVQAVNSHAALVAACKAVLELDTPSEDMGGDWGTVEWCEQVGHVIEQAREALRLAGDK